MNCRGLVVAGLLISGSMLGLAQENRPLSPTGTAAAQVQGKYVKPASGRGAPALAR
jgi:hypothetical protein